jgi:leucyl-tRNA synthetase
VVAIAQVDGKLRDRFEVPSNISEQDLRELALNSEAVRRAIGDKELTQVIVRAPKLVNIATK